MTPASTALAAPRHHRGRRFARLREASLGYLLVLPALAVLGIFTFYPFVKNFDLAAHIAAPYPGLPSKYVGFHQFTSTVTSSEFLDSLRSTVVFVGISVPLGVFLGLGLAVFANQRLRGMAVFQVIFSSTAITSVAVAGVIFETILSPSNGLMQSLGVHTAPGIYYSPAWAIEAVAGVGAWQFMGLAFIVMLAGLQSLPEEVVEAARLDGASTWQIFWRVIVPLMSPTIFFAVVIGTILGLQSFGVIDIVIGQGQVLYAHTNVLINWIYTLILERNFGQAACVSLALFAITLLATGVQFRLLGRRVHYGY